MENSINKAPCSDCGQYDIGQQGEYPCSTCGLPRVWDEKFQFIPEGTIVVATSGAYSDYSIQGVYKALRDFSIKNVALSGVLWLPKLVKDGFLEEFPAKELYRRYNKVTIKEAGKEG